KLKKLLETSKKNSEQQLETFIRIKREENELLIISSKIKEDKFDHSPKLGSTTSEVKEMSPEHRDPKKRKKEIPVSKPLEVIYKTKPKPKTSKPKLKPVNNESKQINIDQKIELYEKYEKSNPRKKAVYRGKETKGFLEWKKNQKF
ncbi:MAG: hypothetical protein ACW972_02485, partial [Promethearchaeota archaeon]